jgi:hypothetical protein
MKARPWAFTLENHDSVLEEHHHKCNPHVLPTSLVKADAARYQISDTREEPVSLVFIATKNISSPFQNL